MVAGLPHHEQAQICALHSTYGYSMADIRNSYGTSSKVFRRILKNEYSDATKRDPSLDSQLLSEEFHDIARKSGKLELTKFVVRQRSLAAEAAERAAALDPSKKRKRSSGKTAISETDSQDSQDELEDEEGEVETSLPPALPPVAPSSLQTIQNALPSVAPQSDSEDESTESESGSQSDDSAVQHATDTNNQQLRTVEPSDLPDTKRRKLNGGATKSTVQAVILNSPSMQSHMDWQQENGVLEKPASAIPKRPKPSEPPSRPRPKKPAGSSKNSATSPRPAALPLPPSGALHNSSGVRDFLDGLIRPLGKYTEAFAAEGVQNRKDLMDLRNLSETAQRVFLSMMREAAGMTGLEQAIFVDGLETLRGRP